MRKVLVSTDKRGVFFGELVSHEGDRTTLKDCRMVVYWSPETKGFLGLAANGPADGSRVSPAAPQTELVGVTSVSDVSEAAAQRFEAGPWS